MARSALLRSHLHEIVYRLQNCLRVDIGDRKLPENFPFLLKSIRDSATQEFRSRPGDFLPRGREVTGEKQHLAQAGCLFFNLFNTRPP